MENKNEKKSLSEDVKKMLYRANYSINETPKYKPIIEDESEFDNLPVEIYSTQDGQPVPNPAGTDAYLEGGKIEDDNAEQLPGAEELAPTDPVAEPSNAPAPDVATPEEIPTEEPAPEVDAEFDIDVEATPEEMPPAEPEVSVDVLQNEIIKNNIAAMQSINDKLEGLDQTINNFSAQVEELNADVEEVREPTNVEKLMAQKDVSYPYYFNLNDFWKGSFFEQQRNAEGPNEQGVRELPDGTYIADFDDLTEPSKTDIEDSFNKLT